MDWKEKNVLVTGGNGLVGSHLVKNLCEKGANVICLSRSHNPNSYFASEKLETLCAEEYGDLKDFARILDVVCKNEVDYIFHLGAQAIVKTGIKNPLETFDSNIMGTANILEAARLYGEVEGIVVASSDKAYGSSEKLPYTEDMPLHGDYPYDVSKSCTDLISQSYSKSYGLPVCVARFGNIYGEGDLNFNRIIPGCIHAGILNECLNIRSNGKLIREYVYVGDVVSGYLSLSENMKKTCGEAFNLSSGEELTVLDVVKQVSSVLGKNVKYLIIHPVK